MLQENTIQLFLDSILMFIFSLFIVYFSRFAAIKLRFFDVPDKKMKDHKKITPYLGGLVFFISMFIFLLPFYGLGYWQLIFGLILISGLGLIDDIFKLSALLRLCVQILFCSILILFLFSSLDISLDEIGSIALFCLFVFFGVGIINSINFVDIGDGLCGITYISFVINIILISNFAFASEDIILESSLTSLFPALAFLFLNAPRARIFLGDFGSYLIGGLIFSYLAYFYAALNFNIALSIAITLLLIPLPILDLAKVIIVRLFLNLNPMKGSKHHLKHNLDDLKINDQRAHMAVYFVLNSIPALSYNILLI